MLVQGTKGIWRKGSYPKMGFKKGRTPKAKHKLWFERGTSGEGKKGGK